MDWLQDNAELLSAFATILMTIAWVIYAQFAIVTYLRHRQPRIVIDQTEDRSIDTKFVVVNLSEQPVYVSCVMVAVRRGDEETLRKINTYQQPFREDGEAEVERVDAEHRHGTLAPAQLLMLGSSQQTLSWLLENRDDEDEEPVGKRLRQALYDVDNFEIRVVAMVGIDDRPVASSRAFRVERSEESDDILICPEDSFTRQYSSRWDRHVAAEWAEYCVRC